MPKEGSKEELITEAKNFFDTYKKDFADSLRKGNNVIMVDFMKLSEFSSKLAEQVLASAEETLAYIEGAIEESGLIRGEVRVRLINMPVSQQLDIRNIRSKHLNEFIVLEGIIRQSSDVRPQVVNAKFECPSCGTNISLLQMDKKFVEPSRCSCGRRGGFKLVSKKMVDTQRLVIEEAPESLRGGEQPKRMNVFVKEDLVEPKMEEKTTPGSRIKVIGVLKEVPVPLATGGLSTRFELALEANNIVPLDETFEELNITEEDEKKILELSKDPEVFEKFAKSIVPSVWGYEDVKRALVLQLFGGVRKVYSDGQKRRGDIHVLLIGDPGVAKSSTLNFMADISPKGRYVVGKSTSGAGLTATVVRDEYLRGWSLEAGAMVLANKGLVCIDELEKMDPQERSAMHEAMEQQCYHHDTVLTMADGSEIKIGELVEKLLEQNKDKIINGKDCLILPCKELEVLTTDFTKIYKTKVDRISKHKAFDKFIKIKFSHGREIIVTPEHPVFIAQNGEITTKRADEIKIGDSIPIPLQMPIEGEEQYFYVECYNKGASNHIKVPQKNGPELFKILGYLISEGSKEINRNKLIGVNFANKDQRLLDEFESLMNKIFGLSPYKQARIDENGIRWMYRYISSELSRFLKQTSPEILKTAGDKAIPSWAMKGRKEDLAHMLSTLFEGDGCVSAQKRTIRIEYKTKSRRLSEQIQDLLLRFGIRSSITKDREYRRVGITSYDNIKSFQEKIGFVTEEKNKIIANYINEKTIKRQIKDVIPLAFNNKIISVIREEGVKKVGKYLQYGIIYDHQKRRDTFTFSRDFLRKMLPQIKRKENQEFIRSLTEDIGWEQVSGIEVIDNERENWVYDVTIEPNHAFISQAAVLHNTITVSKANVQATLRAETSVLAAANPKLGRFNPEENLGSQFDLPVTLINRFDVIFPLRDIPNKEKDRKIARHVLDEHKTQGRKMEIPRELFRKYIAYARQKVVPKLSDEASDEIEKFYIELRSTAISEGSTRPIPISARQLEALIRMSEASAKMRLDKVITREDARRAIGIMKSYMMQVGYDEESKTFDIDKVSGTMAGSKRNKVFMLRTKITELEERLGKLIPIEELQRELNGKMTPDEIDDAIVELLKNAIIFEPKKGYVQKMG